MKGRRAVTAEEGIRVMNNMGHLLVITNDKLRHQFGNLK